LNCISQMAHLRDTSSNYNHELRNHIKTMSERYPSHGTS
jgi:hypothetical protein